MLEIMYWKVCGGSHSNDDHWSLTNLVYADFDSPCSHATACSLANPC